eukprot:Nk52_evm52s226 gene=Nk52_evmTU52s226
MGILKRMLNTKSPPGSRKGLLSKSHLESKTTPAMEIRSAPATPAAKKKSEGNTASAPASSTEKGNPLPMEELYKDLKSVSLESQQNDTGEEKSASNAVKRVSISEGGMYTIPGANIRSYSLSSLNNIRGSADEVRTSRVGEGKGDCECGYIDCDRTGFSCRNCQSKSLENFSAIDEIYDNSHLPNVKNSSSVPSSPRSRQRFNSASGNPAQDAKANNRSLSSGAAVVSHKQKRDIRKDRRGKTSSLSWSPSKSGEYSDYELPIGEKRSERTPSGAERSQPLVKKHSSGAYSTASNSNVSYVTRFQKQNSLANGILAELGEQPYDDPLDDQGSRKDSNDSGKIGVGQDDNYDNIENVKPARPLKHVPVVPQPLVVPPSGVTSMKQSGDAEDPYDNLPNPSAVPLSPASRPKTTRTHNKRSSAMSADSYSSILSDDSALTLLACTQDPKRPPTKNRWYYSDIDRYDAERLLLECDNDCTPFLVRGSSSSSGENLSLSFRRNNRVIHLKIRFVDGVYILGENSQPFDDVIKMILYFRSNGLKIRGGEPIYISNGLNKSRSKSFSVCEASVE